MKVQFHLKGQNQPLYYPENAADVTMEEFIYFHKNLLPRYPVIEIEALQIQNVMDETYEKIKQYAKKLKVEVEDIGIRIHISTRFNASRRAYIQIINKDNLWHEILFKVQFI